MSIKKNKVDLIDKINLIDYKNQLKYNHYIEDDCHFYNKYVWDNDNYFCDIEYEYLDNLDIFKLDYFDYLNYLTTNKGYSMAMGMMINMSSIYSKEVIRQHKIDKVLGILPDDNFFITTISDYFPKI